MTIDEILTDEALRQREFPIARERAFFAHAGVCPLPRCVADAIKDYTTKASGCDQEKSLAPGLLTNSRRLAAQLLACQADEVAFVGPTSLALSLIASGLKFRRGENILIYFDDYPSNVYPWMAFAEQGVQVRLMNTRGLGLIRLVDVMGQVDENTRLVALASCHFISGYRIDLSGIGRFLRERGILFCVDGIQTAGAFPTSVEFVDMLAADAHKWLLGPCAAGLLYVRCEVRERVNPPVYGWHNVQCPDFISQEQIHLRTDCRKFEVGTHNWLGLAGFAAAMEMILSVGVDAIAQELLRKRAWMVPALEAKGCRVLHAGVPVENQSAIISFDHPGHPAADLHRKLLEANVVTSLRVDRAGKQYVRLSPHFYNTDAELQRVLEVF
jgi:selenocysteine lyase/cysteine desulfurase